jgi:hypothetical protein
MILWIIVGVVVWVLLIYLVGWALLAIASRADDHMDELYSLSGPPGDAPCRET